MSKLPTLLVPGQIRAEGVSQGETPLAFIQRWIRKRMPEFGGHSAALADRILIVRSKTGSGKSTALVVGLFRILRDERTDPRIKFHGPGVICTQPRVLTAISLATDVSSGGPDRPYRDMVLGETVGFQTGPISNRPPAGLIYATAGVLAAQLRQQEDSEIMGRYWCIVVDEAHERSLDSDMNLMLLRDFYHRNAGNPRLPFLILASATFDPPRYASYFGVGAANVVEVEGRAYEITEHWPARGTNNYWAEAVAVALSIHESHPDDPPAHADVLIFVPGAQESLAIARELIKANEKYVAGPAAGPTPGPMLVLQLNRDVVNSQSGDYPLALEKNPARLPAIAGYRPRRRVFVATNVAETGLTLPQLRYVVDCGWSRAREVYQPWGAEGLVTRPAPQSRVEQRKGRAGRLFPGDFYPLYTRNVFDSLERLQLPDIYTLGPASVHLAAIQEQQRQKLRTGQTPEFRIEDVALLDPPAPEAFLAANAVAVALGFVSARAALLDRWPPEPLDMRGGPTGSGAERVALGYGLTPLGHLAAGFSRTPMEGVRILLAGYIWDAAASDLATLVALLGSGSVWAREPQAKAGNLPAGAEALRAALPPYLVQRTGGQGVAGGAAGAAGRAALPPAESEMFYFRARLLLADDFVEVLLVYDAFVRRVEGAGADLGAVANWCGGVGLDFAALVELTRRRETVQEEMVMNGLNPFRAHERRLASLPIEGFVGGLSRLKRCLYDGLRHQLLRYDDSPSGAPGYVSRQGLRVRVPELLSDPMTSRLRALRVTAGTLRPPRWLLTDQIKLVSVAAGTAGAQPLLFQLKANRVSVLDGYVDADPDFDTARSFGSA